VVLLLTLGVAAIKDTRDAEASALAVADELLAIGQAIDSIGALGGSGLSSAAISAYEAFRLSLARHLPRLARATVAGAYRLLDPATLSGLASLDGTTRRKIRSKLADAEKALREYHARRPWHPIRHHRRRGGREY
jgi:hypothetical protein